MFSLTTSELHDRKFHREYFKRRAKSFVKVRSDKFGKDLKYNLMLTNYRRFYNRIGRKKHFFSGLDLYSIDIKKYLNFEFLNDQTYEQIADLINVDVKELKNRSDYAKSWFFNFEVFLQKVKENNI